MGRYFFPMPNVDHWPFPKKDKSEPEPQSVRDCSTCGYNRTVQSVYSRCRNCAEVDGYPEWMPKTDGASR